MTEPKLKILLIDDEDSHRKEIVDIVNTSDKTNITIINPEFSEGLKEIKAAIAEQNPTDLFIDYYIPGNGNLTGILKKLGKERVGNRRIWIISGYNISHQLLFEEREKWPNIEHCWLQKPITKYNSDDLLVFLRIVEQVAQQSTKKDKKTFPMEDIYQWISSIPLPVRIIDTKTQSALHTNDAWPMAQNRPEIEEVDLTDIDAESLKELTCWHFADKREEKKNRLITTTLFKSKGCPDIVYQILKDHAVETSETLEQLVEKIFAALKGLGFLRGRFYKFIRIPNTLTEDNKDHFGILELVARSGEGYPQGQNRKLPVQYPVYEFWRNRIEKVEKKDNTKQENNNDKDKLICDLLSNNINNKNIKKSKDYKFWKNFNFKKLPESASKEDTFFLEIPLFKYKGTNKRCIGFFIFDRWDGKDITKFPKIEDTHIKLVEDSLLSMIEDIRKKMLDEQEIKAHKLHNTIDKYDKEINENTKLEPALKKLLTKALELANATQGLISYRPGNADHLKVLPEKIGFPSGTIFPNDRPLWATKVFQNKKPIYCPDYGLTKSKRKDAFKDGEKFIKEILARPNATTTSEEYFANLKSCIVLPIKSGNEVIGSLSLHHHKTYHFTNEIIESIQSLLDSCRWYLKYLTITNELMLSEYAFLHEVRSNIGQLKNNFHALSITDKNSLPSKKDIELNLQSLLDLSRIKPLLRKGKEVDGNTDETFELPDLVEKNIALYQNIIDIKGLTVKNELSKIQTPPLLQGKNTDFALIFRIIFDNSVKFSTQHGTIRIMGTSNHETGKYRISVSNSGEISEKQKEMAFIPEPIFYDEEKKKDGAHIGLAVSKKIAEFYGAGISIDNDSSKENVIVTINWPIAENNNGK